MAVVAEGRGERSSEDIERLQTLVELMVGMVRRSGWPKYDVPIPSDDLQSRNLIIYRHRCDCRQPSTVTAVVAVASLQPKTTRKQASRDRR